MKLLYSILSVMFLVHMAFGQGKPVREPVAAGTFYPAEPDQLSEMIQKYLQNAKLANIDGEILGMVSPHAGYIYSGIVAAQGYKKLNGRHYDNVIVISPSHVERFSFSSIMKSGSYKTPLGKVPIDEELSAKIAKGRQTIRLSGKGHFQTHLRRQEHSLEVQLPFLQEVLGEFNLVPIVMGLQSRKACEELADAIYQASKERKLLVIASSDLSHYHSYNEAQKIDQRCVSLIEEFKYDELFRKLRSQKVEACGGAPIVAMLMATDVMKADRVNVLMYANSGDTAGNKSQVVGYVSAIAVKGKNEKASEKTKKNQGDTIYSQNERNELLQIARTSIECCVKGESIPTFDIKSPKLKEKRGAFVTINKFGQLRGCIGFTKPVFPLHETIQKAAQAAALEDPRFPRIKSNELKHLHIELSILTLPKKINDAKEIQIGKHGLIIKNGYQQGLLLPQVATQYGWDQITFLEHTCKKAGLHNNAWKDPDTDIFVFSAEVFGE